MDDFIPLEADEALTTTDQQAAGPDGARQSPLLVDRSVPLGPRSMMGPISTSDWTATILLEAGGIKKQHRVHARLLQKDSPWFRELLSSNWDIAGNGLIRFPDISPATMSFYIDLVYSDRCRLKIKKLNSIRREYDLDGIIHLMSVYEFARSIRDNSMCDLLATAIVDIFSLIRSETRGTVWVIDQSIINYAYNAPERMPYLNRILVSVCCCFHHPQWLEGAHPDFIKDLAFAALQKKYPLQDHGDVCSMHMHAAAAKQHCPYAGRPYGVWPKSDPGQLSIRAYGPRLLFSATSNIASSAQCPPSKKRKFAY